MSMTLGSKQCRCRLLSLLVGYNSQNRIKGRKRKTLSYEHKVRCYRLSLHQGSEKTNRGELPMMMCSVVLLNQRKYNKTRLLSGCGGRTWTCDLRVMSPTSYQLLYSAILHIINMMVSLVSKTMSNNMQMFNLRIKTLKIEKPWFYWVFKLSEGLCNTI